MNREIYIITLHPGRRAEEATARLAKAIIDRWMPNHAGGAPLLIGPGLCQLLHPFFQKANQRNRDVMLRIDTTDTRPVITEIGSTR
jgi:hypothetical protein